MVPTGICALTSSTATCFNDNHRRYPIIPYSRVRGRRAVLTNMTPNVLRFMSSMLMLCVLLCNRLATSLTTLSRVLPTGGSSTPHVVFKTFFCWWRTVFNFTSILVTVHVVSWRSQWRLFIRTGTGQKLNTSSKLLLQHGIYETFIHAVTVYLWGFQQQLVNVFESGSHSLQDAVGDWEWRMGHPRRAFHMTLEPTAVTVTAVLSPHLSIYVYTYTQGSVEWWSKLQTYAGFLVSNRLRRIWITLTIADSFFSLSKMLASSCSTVSCLKQSINEQMRREYYLWAHKYTQPSQTTSLCLLKMTRWSCSEGWQNTDSSDRTEIKRVVSRLFHYRANRKAGLPLPLFIVCFFLSAWNHTLLE